MYLINIYDTHRRCSKWFTDLNPCNLLNTALRGTDHDYPWLLDEETEAEGGKELAGAHTAGKPTGLAGGRAWLESSWSVTPEAMPSSCMLQSKQQKAIGKCYFWGVGQVGGGLMTTHFLL